MSLPDSANSSSRTSSSSLSLDTMQRVLQNRLGEAMNQNNRLRVVLVIFLVLVGVYYMYSGRIPFFGSFGNDSSRTVTVIGIGTQTVKPDSAVVSFSYTRDGVFVEDTIDEGESVFNDIVGGLNTFNPKSVNKSTYQLVDVPRSRVDETGEFRRVTSYQYVNAASVTVEPAVINEVVKYLYEAGASEVSQIRYVPENEEQIDAELRKMAIEDARAKVVDMARAAGARVGRVVAIQEGGSTTQGGSSITTGGASSYQAAGNTAEVGDAMVGDAMTGTINEVGNIELQSVVSVVYELR